MPIQNIWPMILRSDSSSISVGQSKVCLLKIDTFLTNHNRLLQKWSHIVIVMEPEELLQQVKSTVEGLLSVHTANVWSLYGGLKRLSICVENILNHQLKYSQVRNVCSSVIHCYWRAYGVCCLCCPLLLVSAATSIRCRRLLLQLSAATSSAAGLLLLSPADEGVCWYHQYLLLSSSAAVCCYCLLQLSAATVCCYCLLLLSAAAVCCYCLLQLQLSVGNTGNTTIIHMYRI